MSARDSATPALPSILGHSFCGSCHGISATVIKEDASASILPLVWQILPMFPAVALAVTWDFRHQKS